MKFTNAVSAFIIMMLGVGTLPAATEDLGNGFLHHGVATPVSNHRGTVATVDGQGRDIVLVWLFDLRGGYALLLIDAETGKSEEYPMPFPPGGDCPYSSILSSRNRFYTHFNSHFVEFDPAKPGFTFHFTAGIARVQPADHRIILLAKSPVPIHCGGDYLDGRIYFSAGSHMYSYRVSEVGGK